MLLFFLGLLCPVSLLFAQEWNRDVLLSDWRMQTETMPSDRKVSYLTFGSAYVEACSGRLLPVWRELLSGNSGRQLRVEMKDARWAPLSETEKSTLPLEVIDTLSSSVQVLAMTTRHQSQVEVRVVPFRRQSGRYEKLLSCRLQGKWQAESMQKAASQKVYAAQSVLASGEIYKIALSRTGVYKLTYAHLESMGVSMSGQKIRNIAIYGNGGFQLPENTHEPVPDDVREIPVKAVDADGDGIFDPEDYLVFYARGVVEWKYADGKFTHTLNCYSDYAYYFVKINQFPEKTWQTETSVSTAATHELASYTYHGLLEEDLIAPTGVGRVWFKDLFDAVSTRDYSFTLPELEPSTPVSLSLGLAASSPSYASYFSYKADGGSLGSCSFSSGSGSVRVGQYAFMPASPSAFSLQLTYSKPSNTSKGWLDYIEVFASCRLKQSVSQVDFRCPSAVGTGHVAEYRMDACGQHPTVWDVTDPWNGKEIAYTMGNDGVLKFRLPADSLREFVSFYGSSLYEPVPIGRVTNQNLHAAQPADLVIVTHPAFLSHANQLADFRRSNDNLRVMVVTTEQIYNEFGSGAADISAIRNFLRMLYERYPSDAPENVLLFGKVSYDFRDRKQMGSCYIPNYQASDIFDVDACLATDDYFVKLDDYEGSDNKGSMDMGIGRLPVSTSAQAAAVLQKIRNYASMQPLESTSSNRVPNLGDWRNLLTFCADDDADDMGHIFNADNIARMVAAEHPVYNIDKIYLDAYKKVSTSQGQRYPEATDALNQRVNNGSLWITYMGHGGDNGWAHERFLKRSDINGWTNRYNYPFFFAGACSFGEYDKLSAVSPSEDMLFKADGGAIGVISATRSSYGGTNEAFGMALHKEALAEDSSGNHLTMGEVFARAKNRCGSVQMYVLLGDPSMMLAFPKGQVHTDSINGSAQLTKDTLRALSYVSICGHVSRSDGSVDEHFNGYVYPSIYDKTATVTTLLNNSNSVQKTFSLQKNILYKGKVSVSGGYFRFGFLLPKDINYDDGFGKISYYACGSGTDANGCDSVPVGGVKDTVIADEWGPEIHLYLNEESFVSGGITGNNPTLLARISDDNGVNTAGIGIGHDLVAILDRDESSRVILNDYFECDENSSLSGQVRYLFSDLQEGVHELTLRAWDVLNNRSEATLSFTVTDQQELKLDHVLNYPNPFTTHTQFYFEHNQMNSLIEARIQIFTVSGKPVRTILHSELASSFRCGPIGWDGCDDFGGRLAKGTYLYRLSVRTADGKTAEKIEKLVIL